MTFPTPTPADWRVLAEKALKDRPLENLVHLDPDGLAVRPLYAAATGGQPVFGTPCVKCEAPTAPADAPLAIPADNPSRPGDTP